MTAARELAISTRALVWREAVRFARQRSRLIGALATPVLFWLVIGSGLNRSFAPPGTTTGESYLSYFFPGTVMLIVLFTAIFSCISIIEDRREGFLQSVLAAPVPPIAVVAGKVGGAAVLAVAQGTLFLLAAPLVHASLTPLRLLESLLVLALSAVGLASIGFVFAWRLDSVQGFHAVMNLLLMPMWLLSGALFPAAGAQAWVRWVMIANPLTYAVAALRAALGTANAPGAPDPWVCWLAMAAVGGAAASLAVREVRRTERGNRE